MLTCVDDAIAFARKALTYLGSRAGIEIETASLQLLAKVAFEAGGAGKVSGAGGGDCGIAFATSVEQADAVRRAWREAGIEPLALAIASVGASETRSNGVSVG